MKSKVTKQFEAKSTLRAYSEGGFIQSLRNAMGMGNNAERRSRIDAAVDKAAPPPPRTPPPPPQPEPPKKEFRFNDGGYVDPETVGVVAPGMKNGGKLRAYCSGGMVPERMNMAKGGKVSGKGGPREDKVGPLMLSAGEYVLPAKTVEAVGGPEHLDQVVRETNDGREPGAKVVKNGKIGAAAGGYLPGPEGDPTWGQRLRNMGSRFTGAAGAAWDAAGKAYKDFAPKAQKAAADAARAASEYAGQSAFEHGQRVGEAGKAVGGAAKDAASAAREFGAGAARGAGFNPGYTVREATMDEWVKAGGKPPPGYKPTIEPGPASGAGKLGPEAAAERLRQMKVPVGGNAGAPPPPGGAGAAAAGAGGRGAGMLSRLASVGKNVLGPLGAAYGGWELGSAVGEAARKNMTIDETDTLGGTINQALRAVGLGVNDDAYLKYKAGRSAADIQKDQMTNAQLEAQNAARAPGAVPPAGPIANATFSDARTEAAAGRNPGEDEITSRLRQLGADMVLRPDLGDANNRIAQFGRNTYAGIGNGTPMAPTGVRFASDADIARLRDWTPDDIMRGYKQPMQTEAVGLRDPDAAARDARNERIGLESQIKEMTRFRPSEGARLLAGLHTNAQDNAQRAADSALRARTATEGHGVTMRGQDITAGTALAGQQTAAQTARARLNYDIANTIRQQANSDRDYALNVARFGTEEANRLRDDYNARADKAVEHMDKFAENSFFGADGKADAARGAAFKQAMAGAIDKDFLSLNPAAQRNALGQATTAFKIMEAFNKSGGVWADTIESLPQELKTKAPEFRDWIVGGASLADIVKAKAKGAVGFDGRMVEGPGGQVRSLSAVGGGSVDQVGSILRQQR